MFKNLILFFSHFHYWLAAVVAVAVSIQMIFVSQLRKSALKETRHTSTRATKVFAPKARQSVKNIKEK